MIEPTIRLRSRRCSLRSDQRGKPTRLATSATDFQTDRPALSVGAAAGPSRRPGKAPGHGWACRAADLIEPTINSIMPVRPPAPTSIVSESGDPSSRLQHRLSSSPCPRHGWACRAADLIEPTINSVMSVRHQGPRRGIQVQGPEQSTSAPTIQPSLSVRLQGIGPSSKLHPD